MINVQFFLAYLMIGMGVGVLVKAAGGTPEIAFATGVALVCGLELIKRLFQK